MSWNKHHSQSVEYAIEAEIAIRRGDFDAAAKQYHLAAEEEILALDALDPKKTRTIGISAVSAASLYYKANDFKQVECIARKWLANKDLPEFAVLQLKKFLQTVCPSYFIGC